METKLLEQFGAQCFRHLVPGARMHIELGRLRWGSYRTTGTMFVARHYGLPTRGIDWTRNGLVALFFACRRSPSKDGAVWSMGIEDFENHVAKQWQATYGKCGHIEEDFERDFVKGIERNVLVPLYFPPWMPRATAQFAFVTIGSFGMNHAEKLRELGVTTSRRVIIPQGLKSDVLKKLDELGINGHTLEVGDSTIETIANDIAQEACPKGSGAGT